MAEIHKRVKKKYAAFLAGCHPKCMFKELEGKNNPCQKPFCTHNNWAVEREFQWHLADT
jgi:hypothetical protein